MKYSFFKKNGQAERSYRIGISLLSLLFLLSMLISSVGGVFESLTNGNALQKGFLFPVQSASRDGDPVSSRSQSAWRP